jgi:hypothetical protein
MRKILLSSFAIASLLAGPAMARPAAAVQPIHGVTAGPTQIAAVMCGTNGSGCGQVQTKRQIKQNKFKTLGHG